MFNIDLRAITSLNNVSISEYAKVSDRLAKVVIVCSGNDKESLTGSLKTVLKDRAVPVTASFRWLVPGESAIGFVTPIVETIVADTKVLANFRLISSAQNLYMKPGEDSMWELKTGVGGRYLSKTAPDDLGELIESVRAGRMGAPRMSSVSLSASVSDKGMANRLVAYVSDDGVGRPFTEYGFCVGTREGKPLVMIQSNTVEVVDTDRIVAHYEVDHSEIREIVSQAHRLNSALADKSDVISYYKALYGYDKDYLNKVIKVIEDQAAM